jgi:hypothetical protein
MDGQDNRLLLERYLAGLLDAEQEYALRHEDVVIDMPQSGERIRGRDNMKAMQPAHVSLWVRKDEQRGKSNTETEVSTTD